MLPVFQQVEAQLAAQAAASPEVAAAIGFTPATPAQAAASPAVAAASSFTPATPAVAAASGSADPYPPGQWGHANASPTETQWEHHIMLLRMALESAEALRRSAQADKKEPP